MITEKRSIRKLYTSVGKTTSAILNVVASFTENGINQVPFAGSWTAAQVAEHVTRSNTGITGELQKEGKACDREPDAGVEELKSVFLNFTAKLKSPEFILPTKNTYLRQTVIKDLQRSIENLKGASRNADLFQLIDHSIFGEVSKLELLHFVVYHTQRHVHQLKNIFKTLKDQERTQE